MSTREVKLPRHRLRQVARSLLRAAPTAPTPAPAKTGIKIVCVADTHNNQPELPPGDLLLHAGDLTEWGSFDELQAQLDWLNKQPHQHKVVIAGNHDVLLDEVFLKTHQDTFPVQEGKTAADLNWGNIIYLQDSSTKLQFSKPGSTARSITIYGSPWTPKYLDSAFQHSRTQDVWADQIPDGTDIVLTHGPSWNHLDGGLRSGCPCLAAEIARVRPKLVVFGHIHVGYGREVVRFNNVRALYEEIVMDWRGWETIPLMVFHLSIAWFKVLVGVIAGRRTAPRATELINAAVVGGEGNKLRNDPVVTNL